MDDFLSDIVSRFEYVDKRADDFVEKFFVNGGLVSRFVKKVLSGGGFRSRYVVHADFVKESDDIAFHREGDSTRRTAYELLTSIRCGGLMFCDRAISELEG